MIAITAAEKEMIREQYPNVQIVRTMVKRSDRHKYYMVEERAPMNLLRRIRAKGTVYGAPTNNTPKSNNRKKGGH